MVKLKKNTPSQATPIGLQSLDRPSPTEPHTPNCSPLKALIILVDGPKIT